MLQFVECVCEKCASACGGSGALVSVCPSVNIDNVKGSFCVEGAHGDLDSACGSGFSVVLCVDLWLGGGAWVLNGG